MNPLLKRSDMARDIKGITQFYLPPTHKAYLPLLPSGKWNDTRNLSRLGEEWVTAVTYSQRRSGDSSLAWNDVSSGNSLISKLVAVKLDRRVSPVYRLVYHSYTNKTRPHQQSLTVCQDDHHNVDRYYTRRDSARSKKNGNFRSLKVIRCCGNRRGIYDLLALSSDLTLSQRLF